MKTHIFLVQVVNDFSDYILKQFNLFWGIGIIRSCQLSLIPRALEDPKNLISQALFLRKGPFFSSDYLATLLPSPRPRFLRL